MEKKVIPDEVAKKFILPDLKEGRLGRDEEGKEEILQRAGITHIGRGKRFEQRRRGGG